ncbi:hypothetical protein GGR58DRAFT_516080 [Xylaria digitata]|nr:hypothetical protein GGR58DRAFT_516080 [Xylaria digitata]
MASGTIPTTLLTATSAEHPSMTSLLIAGNPCSDLRVSSCDSSDSCAFQVLPSALCWDDTYSTWAVGSTLSCSVESTALTVPIVTYPERFCPMGMTTATSATKSDGAWCCPLGFTWASASLCQSILTPGTFPQISDACARGNTIPPAPDATESPVTTVFAEALYLAGRTFPASTVIVTQYFTSGASPSGGFPDDKVGDSQDGLPAVARIAIGLGSGIIGAILIFLGVILIRRHRKKQLREAAKYEMTAIPGHGGYIKMGPESGNTSTLRSGTTRTQCELEASSPGYPDDEIIRLYCPELERSTGREYSRERTGSEDTSMFGATLILTSQSEPVELEAEPVSSGKKTVRRNTRASSQVLPWQEGVDDYWALDYCSPRRSDETEDINRS